MPRGRTRPSARSAAEPPHAPPRGAPLPRDASLPRAAACALLRAGMLRAASAREEGAQVAGEKDALFNFQF